MHEYTATPHTLQAAASTHFNSHFPANPWWFDVVNKQYFKSV